MQSGNALGGDGRVRAVIGDVVIGETSVREVNGVSGSGAGETSFREVSGVSGSGVGDSVMELGEDSSRVMDGVTGLHDTSTVSERSALADGDEMASTGAFGSQARRGEVGRSSEAGAGAARGMSAAARTLEEVMASILRDAWQVGGTAAGSGNVWRDDVSVRSARFVLRYRQLCHERPGDVATAWRQVLALFKSTYNPPAGKMGISGSAQPLTRLATGKLIDFLEQDTGLEENAEFVAWADKFKLQVQDQVRAVVPALKTVGASVWAEPVLPAVNKGGGVSVEITVSKANGDTSQGLPDDLRRLLFPYTMSDLSLMSAGSATFVKDTQMQEWGVRDPPEINTDCRTLMMLKVEDVMSWMTQGKPRDLGCVQNGWWAVRHKGSLFRLRMKPVWTDAELQDRGLRLVVKDKQTRQPSSMFPSARLGLC